MSNIKYPDINVELIGRDGNAFAIIGAVKAELIRHVSQKEANEFVRQALRSPSYDELLRLAMRWVAVS